MSPTEEEVAEPDQTRSSRPPGLGERSEERSRSGRTAATDPIRLE
jgi:hypothetical protein